MAMLMMENSEPAMQLENQLFALPATLTDRWRTEHEKLNPTTILTDNGSAGDINFFIPPSTSGLLSLADMILELEVGIKVRQYVQLSGKLFSDLFDQSKPLCTGVPVNIRLVVSRPEFALRVWDTDTTKTFKPFIRNARLSVRRYIPSPDFLTAVAGELLKKTVKYHIERVVMRVSDIPQRTQSTVISNLQIGQIPKVVFIGFVDSEDFHGSQKKNPFNFQHFNITQISVEVDGQSYPTKPYTADFAHNLSLECYDGLLDTLGHRPSLQGGLPFNRTQYNDGYTIFGFDLTPGHTGRGPLTLIKQGNLSVSVSLANH
ncbi:uncharacterized protein F54H12.2-like [Paramacrobiotus metropolitanus]|uniref:uncharacterized protein F54H12.2-like n=1 Tax=Paramacrobiotus metropolitanus TaxID=2943436 RepID=UPI002446546C|nr:uncharacterized protein F54H12.2-like [Paramacrobiotus metropolitanus]